jgi:glycosyltransferase involved in cell wall biosynthesis
MNSIKFSIITINLNNFLGLRKTIESILKQTYNNFELIIIDGGSFDGSAEICNLFTSNNIIFSSETDKGISDAFNKGIKKGTGDVYFFLNSGDVFINDNVLFEVNKNWNSNIDILFYKVIVNSNISIPSKRYKDDEKKIIRSVDIPHQGAFITSEIKRKNILYNPFLNLRMDYDFFSRLKILGYKFKFIPEPIVKYEEGGRSMNKKNRFAFWKEGMAIKFAYRLDITFKDLIKFFLYYFTFKFNEK